jgi:CheY-like chemotaxis protein/HPt (histidine-containing phosphotransfer) domain-containing protein
MLNRWGHQVTLAGNGREALAAWQTATFDVILMDVQMPEMDGFEVVDAIRRRQREAGSSSPSHRAPIIALTAHATEGDRDRCLAAGMDDYLSKPIRPKQLREALLRATASGVGAAMIDQALHDTVPLQEIVSREVKPAPAAQPSTATEPEIPTDAPPVDWAEALRAVDGDQRLLGELIDTFDPECRETVTRIEGAISEGNAKALRLAAHGLKGALAHLAARPAQAAAQRLESLAAVGDLTGAAAAWQRLREELDRLRPVLAGFERPVLAV